MEEKKIEFTQITEAFVKTGWVQEPEEQEDEVDYVVDEAKDVLLAYGFEINLDERYLITPSLIEVMKLTAIVDEIFPLADDLTTDNAEEMLTKEAYKYWDMWMNDQGDDTYYNYHLTFVSAIADACLEIMEEKKGWELEEDGLNYLCDQVVEVLSKFGFKTLKVKELPDMVDDYGNEYLILIHATPLDYDCEIEVLENRALRALTAITHLNDTLLDSSGDHTETAENPIFLNTTVIFPIKLLK